MVASVATESGLDARETVSWLDDEGPEVQLPAGVDERADDGGHVIVLAVIHDRAVGHEADPDTGRDRLHLDDGAGNDTVARHRHQCGAEAEPTLGLGPRGRLLDRAAGCCGDEAIPRVVGHCGHAAHSEPARRRAAGARGADPRRDAELRRHGAAPSGRATRRRAAGHGNERAP